MADDMPIKSVAHKLSEWAGAMTLLLVFIAGLMYVFEIRSDFDAFVLAHIQHEQGCVKEREHLKEDIHDLKLSVQSLSEKFNKIYFNSNNHNK